MSAEESLQVHAGTLLAAWPDLLDPNFMHRVVLVCQHSEEGAYGLVVNQSTTFALKDLLPEHELLGSSEFPVHLGGPVDHSTMQFLHRAPDRIPGGLCLEGSIWLGGELDAMARFVHEAPDEASEKLRVLLGYSGWGAGQLEGELRANSWLPAPGSTDAVFGETGESCWRRVVRSVGPEGLVDESPDTSWN